MKAKLSMAFEDLRGSDGNVTARGSRSGLTLVKQTRPRQVDSAAVLDVRGNLEDLGATFGTLDQAAVDLWNAFGKSTRKTNSVNGTTYSSTGFAAFVALNAVLLRTSETATASLEPPLASFVPPSIVLDLQPTIGGVVVHGNGSTPASVRLEINAIRLARITRSIPRDGYTSAGFYALDAGDGNEATVPLTAGAYALQYRWVSALDGQSSRWRSLGKILVAFSVERGGVETGTGEALAPTAKPARMKKAA